MTARKDERQEKTSHKTGQAESFDEKLFFFISSRLCFSERTERTFDRRNTLQDARVGGGVAENPQKKRCDEIMPKPEIWGREMQYEEGQK